VNTDQEFIDFINSHKELILKVANVYCFDKEKRKDLVQEIILQLWRSFPNYNPEFKLSTWAYRIALNVCISYVRKTTVRNKALHQYKAFFEWREIEESPVDDENLRKIYQALDILKPIEKAVITLHLDGCSNQEIAKIIGISPSNVSTRLLRIKNKLKKHLKK